LIGQHHTVQHLTYWLSEIRHLAVHFSWPTSPQTAIIALTAFNDLLPLKENVHVGHNCHADTAQKAPCAFSGWHLEYGEQQYQRMAAQIIMRATWI
jgi:hypothetical protein